MLTKKQKQVLDFITGYQKRKGYAPTLHEIRKKFKLASVSTAHFHVSKLRDLGYLAKEENKPRAIDVVGREVMVRVPLLGTIAAGQPIEAIEDKETIAVPKNKLPHLSKQGCVHGLNIRNKKLKSGYPKVLDEIECKYTKWINETEKLNSEKEKELALKTSLLNDYSDYINSISEHFKFQDKLGSSVIEEFLFLLLKDIPGLKENLGNGLLFMGQADAYLNLSFAPRNLKDFINNPGVYINRKNQDFTISKRVGCIFKTNESEEKIELIVPAVAIESKAYIPKTMFDQAAYEAQRLKEGNPFALCIIVAEQNALSNDVNLKNTKIDEVFILRKQKRSKIRKPIDSEIVSELYKFVKNYLYTDWFDNKKATERGKLINF